MRKPFNKALFGPLVLLKDSFGGTMSRVALFATLIAVAMSGFAVGQSIFVTIEPDRAAYRAGDLAIFKVKFLNLSGEVVPEGAVEVVLPRLRDGSYPWAINDPRPVYFLDSAGQRTRSQGLSGVPVYALPVALQPSEEYEFEVRVVVRNSDPSFERDLARAELRGRRTADLVSPSEYADAYGRRYATYSADGRQRSSPQVGRAGLQGMGGPAVLHIEAMFGHLGIVKFACPELQDANTLAICGSYTRSFEQFRELWDLYFDWASETPVIGVALTSWSVEDGIYSRVFEVGQSSLVVAFASGTVAVFISE